MASKNLAKWLRAALAEAENMKGAELGRQLTKALGREIDRAAVNKILSGARAIAADEMLAIEAITGHPVPSPSVGTRVPLLDWVSAGKLIEPRSQIPVEDVPLLAFADLGRGDFFALRVQGDSMDRLSPDGSIIIVDRADQTLIAEKAYVFSTRDGTTFKLWRPEPPHLAPHSWNAANKPHFVKKNSDFAVLGRVRRTVLDL